MKQCMGICKKNRSGVDEIFDAAGMGRKNVEAGKTANIAHITEKKQKKIGKNGRAGKQLITGFFRDTLPGSTDITAKKKLKHLTFSFRCDRKIWTMKKNEVR